MNTTKENAIEFAGEFVPVCRVGEGQAELFDAGDGCVLCLTSGATLDVFEKYVTELGEAGFACHATNAIGENRFATCVSNKSIVNVMFFPCRREIRTAVDSREKFALPTYDEKTQGNACTSRSFTMIGNGQTGYPGGMGFVFKLADGTFYVVDGGISDEGSEGRGVWRWMYQTLRELADDPDNIVISGWLLTHIHNDHMGAFMDMSECEECRAHITVKQVIYNQPSDDWMIAAGPVQAKRLSWMSDSIERWKPESVVKAHPGQKFRFADLDTTVLGSQDIVLPESLQSHNNSSVVTKVWFAGKTLLLLADSEGNQNRYLSAAYGKELDSDVLQVTHHGYDNTEPQSVYALNNASIILWPVSSRHYDNPEKAYVSSLEINKKFFEEGKTDLVARETNIVITDLETWGNAERTVPQMGENAQ